MRTLFKGFLFGALTIVSSATFAGGGGVEQYYCASPTKHVSVTLYTKLGSDLYKPGLQLQVSLGNTISTYEIVTYSDNGNLIQFVMKPVAGEPDLGFFKFSDVEDPAKKTVIQVKKGNVILTASDVKCTYAGP